MNPQLKEIESMAFYSCDNLKEVCFPDAPELFGKQVFAECKFLETIWSTSDTEGKK